MDISSSYSHASYLANKQVGRRFACFKLKNELEMDTLEINQGEVKITFGTEITGKVTLKELGLKDEDLIFESGLIRLVFDFGQMKDHAYYQVPTVEMAYNENMDSTHWQCDFNRETILDKIDNHGHSTVILLDKTKFIDLEQHHENAFVLHAEFPQPVSLIAANSFVHFFK